MFLKKIKFITLLFLLTLLSGCATWSHSSVKKYDNNLNVEKTDPNTIMVTEEDIKKPYVVLGDITATVNKTTIFNKNPSPELVNEKLKEKASNLGADAVILVRYGKQGVSLMSWGSMEGKGRAVKFK